VNKSKQKPFLIGITGTIGSGKSKVGAILEELGIPVIDSDIVVHDLFSKSAPLKEAIRSRFGDGVISGSGDDEKVDRTALGKIVFGDAAARKDLESIVHPATIKECQRRVSEHQDSDLVAMLVPLLFEAGLEKHYDQIWALYTDDAILRSRLSARDNLTPEEVDRRLAAQLPQSDKVSRADERIDNSGTLEETKAQVLQLVEKVKRKLAD